MSDTMMETAIIDKHKRLNSVGLVCSCGRAIATIEGVAKKCECGAIWVITVMRLDR